MGVVVVVVIVVVYGSLGIDSQGHRSASRFTVKVSEDGKLVMWSV